MWTFWRQTDVKNQIVTSKTGFNIQTRNKTEITKGRLGYLPTTNALFLLCLCARLFLCALWSPAGKGLTSWLSFVVSTVSLSLSHWYPWSDVVLDCIDS